MSPLTACMAAIVMMNQCAQIGNEADVFDLEFGVRQRFRRGALP
ncbi:hypothetical protein [Gimesia sp.]